MMVIAIAPDRPPVIVTVSASVRVTAAPSARISTFSALLTTATAPWAVMTGRAIATGRTTVALTPSDTCAPFAPAAAGTEVKAASRAQAPRRIVVVAAMRVPSQGGGRPATAACGLYRPGTPPP